MKQPRIFSHLFIRKNIPVFILFLVMLFNLYTGIMGVDFGFHWDEDKLIGSLRNAAETGLLLPRWYNYPSLCFDLGVAAFMPSVASHYIKTKDTIKQDVSFDLKQYVLEEIRNNTFKIRLRILFVVLTSITLIWIYMAVVYLRHDTREALLASTLTALSWEVSYHSRWIAPDALLMQFGTLAIACLLASLTHPDRRYLLYISALAAGLACSTKYQGGLFLIPLGIAIYTTVQTHKNRRRMVTEFLKVFALFVLTFVLITPGVLVEPLHFLNDVLFEIHHYGAEGHMGYSTHPGITHFVQIIKYLFHAAFSKNNFISGVFFLMALIGMPVLIKKADKKNIVFLIFPIIYLIYFSCQRVMIVRNLLVIVPFFAAFASIGTFFLFDKIRFQAVRFIFALCVVCLLVVNAVWIFNASKSIEMRDKPDYPTQLIEYIDANPDTLFYLSSPIAQEVFSVDDRQRKNILLKYAPCADIAVFYTSEVEDHKRWKANQWNYTVRWFGPFEVNFNYYPTWEGEKRIVLMKPQPFERLGFDRN